MSQNHQQAPSVSIDDYTTVYSHAIADNQNVMAILLKGGPRTAAERAYLARAAESLNAYLAELER